MYKYYDNEISKPNNLLPITYDILSPEILSYFTKNDRQFLTKWSDKNNLIMAMEKSTMAHFSKKSDMKFDDIFSSFEIVSIDVSFEVNTKPTQQYLKEIIRITYKSMNENDRKQFQILSKLLCVAVVGSSFYLLFSIVGFGLCGIVAGSPAAWIMSYLMKAGFGIAAGGWFAILQSIGAKGTWIILTAVCLFDFE